MKVLFLEIETERDWAVASIGPAFLAAYLRAAGHEAAMVRVPLDMDAAGLIEAVRPFAPGLLAVSMTTRQWLRARTILSASRKELGIPVIAGGLHPTFAPEEVLGNGGFDFVCLGEGEQALLDLVVALESGADPGSIPNIWSRGGARPMLRPPFAPVDDLPFAARDLLEERYGVVHMMTQRGCPFPCTYCAAGQYNQLYGRNSLYGRRRSHENVLAELEAIRREGPLNYVIFLDDTFTIHPIWVEEFCQVYGPRLGVPFSLHARADTVTRDLLKQLADAGCRHIVYGVESGSERLRREVMQRPIRNEQMIDAFAWTREAGIMATANYMLGLPTETKEDLEQTFSLHEQLRPYDFGYFVFYPYPGTQLFHYCREHGLLPDDYLDRPANHRESILRLRDLSPADIGAAYDRFTALRERDVLMREGNVVSPDVRATVHETIHQSAALG